jgi:hypothetical protein
MKVFRLVGYLLCLFLVSSHGEIPDASSEALVAIEEFLSNEPPLVLQNEEASGTTEATGESESELRVEENCKDIYQTLAILAFVFAFGKLATLIVYHFAFDQLPHLDHIVIFVRRIFRILPIILTGLVPSMLLVLFYDGENQIPFPLVFSLVLH